MIKAHFILAITALELLSSFAFANVRNSPAAKANHYVRAGVVYSIPHKKIFRLKFKPALGGTMSIGRVFNKKFSAEVAATHRGVHGYSTELGSTNIINKTLMVE